MRKQGAHTGLVHGAHIVKLFLLALERSSEKLLHLDRRRCLRPDAQPNPIPQIEDDHKGEQQLQNSCPEPLHYDSHPTPLSTCQADAVVGCFCVRVRGQGTGAKRSGGTRGFFDLGFPVEPDGPKNPGLKSETWATHSFFVYFEKKLWLRLLHEVRGDRILVE